MGDWGRKLPTTMRTIVYMKINYSNVQKLATKHGYLVRKRGEGYDVGSRANPNRLWVGTMMG
jgi:hypothetical protein